MRKTGPADISYCSTNCSQERCKRNLKYWKAPTQYYSVASFDEECKDSLHIHCENKWLENNNE